MSELLVSVASVAEAEEAIAGGADVIDVKDPSRGALGRADAVVLDAIRGAVHGRRPVSAALGELLEYAGSPPQGFQYVKWGLAGLSDETWTDRWRQCADAAVAQAVFVAYADSQCAQAPSIDEVVAAACRNSNFIVLIDTCCKDKSKLGRRANLLDWLPLADAGALVRQVHAAKGRIALAGSLGLPEVAELLPFQPDWIAVRGAACAGSDRAAAIDRRRVRELKTLCGS